MSRAKALALTVLASAGVGTSMYVLDGQFLATKLEDGGVSIEAVRDAGTSSNGCAEPRLVLCSDGRCASTGSDCELP